MELDLVKAFLIEKGYMRAIRKLPDSATVSSRQVRKLLKFIKRKSKRKKKQVSHQLSFEVCTDCFCILSTTLR